MVYFFFFEILRPVYNQRSSWVVRNPSNTGGIKTVKTVYSSRSMDPINEPMALQANMYQTGSQSQAYVKFLIKLKVLIKV